MGVLQVYQNYILAIKISLHSSTYVTIYFISYVLDIAKQILIIGEGI